MREIKLDVFCTLMTVFRIGTHDIQLIRQPKDEILGME